MAIKSPASGPITGPIGTGAADAAGAVGTGFDQILRTAGPSLADSPQLVEQAAADVAEQVASGKVTAGVEATDAFIARLVELRVGPDGDPSVVAARTDELQLMLGDDPVFVEKVGELLEAARG